MKLSPSRLGLVAALVVVGLMAATRPWVVRPLDADGKAIVGPAKFDAEADAGTLWATRVAAGAADAVDVAKAGPAPAFLKGEGRVTAVDTSSRVGVASVDIDPRDGKADVALQVGPVIQGGMLRDALGLTFADFDTQVDYTNIGASLNKRAIREIPLLADPRALQGRRIRFVGVGAVAPDGRVRIVPVQVTLLP